MTLPLLIREPHLLLAQGSHFDYDWLVTHNNMGYRMGYVLIPPGHPWHKLHYDDIDFGADDPPHGGLTYSNQDVRDDGLPAGTWFGFDAAHYCDQPDPSLPMPPQLRKLLGLPERGRRFNFSGAIRDTDYMIAQCEHLCDLARCAAFRPCLESSFLDS